MEIKVKSFVGYGLNHLEKKLNDWLEKEKNIEIIEVSQSQATEEEINLFVFYKIIPKYKSQNDINI